MSDRMKRFLDESGVKYEVIRHGEAYTAQEIAAAMHVKGSAFVKVVIVRSERGYMMVGMPADRLVDIAALRDELGLRLAAIATESEFRRLFPDCEAGAMPPFGNLYGMPVYVDAALRHPGDIVFQAGTHYESIRMSFTDFERLVSPYVVEASRKAA